MTVALVYAVSVIVGAVMVHSGNQFAVSTRDNVVSSAQNSTILVAYRSGNRLGAAFLDFGSNLLLGAAPQTLGGLGVLPPYVLAAYRGWIGGIVSIDSNHKSRLANPDSARYYASVLVLQLIPYSLTGGAGVNLGWAYLRPALHYRGDKWLGLPKEAILDVFRIYALSVPLFFVASLVEFLA
jgi:hypothetical protein